MAFDTPAILAILRKNDSGGDDRDPPDAPPPHDDDGDSALLAATQDLLASIRANDAQGTADALRTAIEAVMAGEPDTGDNL